MIELLSFNKCIKCVFIERVNRFVVKVRIDEEERNVHINNTGRLKSLFVRNFVGYCIPINGKKLNYRLFAIGRPNNKYFSIIDTSVHMKTFEKLIEKRLIESDKGFSFKRNPQFEDSVFDYILYNKKERIIVEIKSALMFDNDFAMYPDAPTKRGIRHFKKLIELKEKGMKTMIIFVSSIPNVKGFKINKKISPEIAELLIEANRVGVLLKSFNVLFAPEKSAVFLEKLNLPVFINKNF